MATAEVQLWFVGANESEALDADIFPTIDAAMAVQDAENQCSLPGDEWLHIYAATVLVRTDQLERRG